ncbi:MAG: DUF4432 family protein [Chloroflexi bacterium]|nr:MAG: DUF4432 family protein [Chloroflexota bacterium]
MSWQSVIHLQPYFFTDAEKTVAEFAGMTARAFRFASGVAGLRLVNPQGQITVLPYQGQQVWDAQFLGRTLTMKSMFDQPYPTTEYLHTYGAFVVHCGATAMGVPSEQDSHPLHGELPNAPYQTAQLLLGEDESGPYMGVTGTYRYTVAFSHNYVAQPLVKLHANAARLVLSMTVRNLKKTPMELMYLAHVNFRPVDHGRLVYSAPCDPQHVRVRSSIPSHIHPPEGYREFLQELERHPEKHNVLVPELAFDPEVVFFIDYLADEAGWAHSMQVHPDGSADFISHRPAELDHGIRWISRTADQDCLGIVLPATAEPEGYSAEKAKGNLKIVPPGGEFRCELVAGALTPDEAARLEEKINRMLAG